MIYLHPEVAQRSCQDCARWEYRSDGTLLTRGLNREPVARLPGSPTPCGRCPKIPPDAPARTPAYAQELSERNLWAWQHYLRCKAVGQFPDDAIVRRNAAIIAEVEKEIDHLRQARLFEMLQRSD